MKRLLFLFLFIGLACGAQPFTLNDPIFRGAFITPQGPPPPAFYPTNVTGAYFFLSYLDLPMNARPAAWTNILNRAMIYTNNGTICPTNSSLGVYFNTDIDTYGNFYNGGVSGGEAEWGPNAARMSNTADSVWITLNYIKGFNGGSWAAFLNTIDSVPTPFGGNSGGFYLSDVSVDQPFLYYDPGSETETTFWKAPTSRTIMDIAILRDGNIYTNGVHAGSYTAVDYPDQKLCGIGSDSYGSYAPHNTYIKFVAIYTNYNFSLADIAALHSYSTNN